MSRIDSHGKGGASMAQLVEGPSASFIAGDGLPPNTDQIWVLGPLNFLDIVLVSVDGTVPGDDQRPRDLEVTHVVYDSEVAGFASVITVRNVGPAPARYGIRTCLIT
jgi:hypothetical protein